LADLLPGARVRDVMLILGGAGFTGLLAQISVPVYGSPVPVTGQTLAVLLVGAGLGSWRAFASLALYLLAGMAGVPWFAGHTHGVHLATLGYVIGFVVAATAVGALAARGADRTPLRVVAVMILGNAIIYVFGVGYLMADLHLSLSGAIDIGLTNYLLGDAVKILAATALLPGAWKLLSPTRGSTEP